MVAHQEQAVAQGRQVERRSVDGIEAPKLLVGLRRGAYQADLSISGEHDQVPVDQQDLELVLDLEGQVPGVVEGVRRLNFYIVW